MAIIWPAATRVKSTLTVALGATKMLPELVGEMLKRFLIGFVLGIGAMYWYIHSSEDVIAGTTKWFERSASGYRDDKAHLAIERETGR